MNYNIPTVLTAEELIEKTFHRASKITKNGSDALDTKKKTILAKITASGDIVVTTLGGYIQRFPRMEKEEDFQPELVDLVIGIDQYKKSLGALNWASNRTEKLKNESLREVRRTKDPQLLDSIRNSFYGRLSSYIHQISKDLLFLQDAKNKFRALPSIDPSVPTLVVAGFPNVGKSKLVTELSTATPQIAPYPFTTKGIIVGHIEDEWRKFQVIDTPGLLDRSFEDRNDIEKQAVLALRYLTDIMIFIIDPSETCGYSMTKQMALLESVQKGFVGVPIIVAESKLDIIRTNSDNIHFSAQTGEGMDELRSMLIKQLREIFRERSIAAEI
ncbi:MAG: 50S ribosome-binding GTPase [Candidatus Methanogranum gryphiswaldense]|nr:MAG: 50S ribosome-binding GTPase [Candidatus Methanogranum sp. U3.2.1]